jgi:hypothetical protein
LFQSPQNNLFLKQQGLGPFVCSLELIPVRKREGREERGYGGEREEKGRGKERGEERREEEPTYYVPNEEIFFFSP